MKLIQKVKNIILIILLIIFSTPIPISAESVSKKVKKGVLLYENGDYENALKELIDAQVEAPLDQRIMNNIASTHYRMGNYEEAANYFAKMIEEGGTDLVAKAYYNLGNTSYRQGKLDEAMILYQKTLELNPDDEDARYNLDLVREEIKRRINEAKDREEQEKEKEQKENGGQCPNPQEGEREDDEEAERGRSGEGESGGEEKEQEAAGAQQGGSEEDKEEGEGEAAAAREMTEEEAERWLNTLEEDQREFLKRQMKIKGRGYSPGKDW